MVDTPVRSETPKGNTGNSRIAAFVSVRKTQAEVETRLAEREIEQWRSARAIGAGHLKSPETPSRDYIQQRYSELFSSPTSSFDRPMPPRSSAAVHANCVTRFEHELKLRELSDSHVRELDSLRSRLTDQFSVKMREFEDNCIEQYKAKVKSLEATHVSNADVIELQAKLDAFALNEEIITRKFEGKLARMEIALQDMRGKLGKEQERTEELTALLEERSKETEELRERVQTLRDDQTFKEAIEQERRNRERLACDYKRVAIELAEEKLRNKHDIDGEAKRQMKSLQRKNEHLTKQLKDTENQLNVAESTISSMKKAESLPRKQSESVIPRPAPSVDSAHVEDLRHFYEKKLVAVSEELLQWKNKSISLVTRFYPVLKQLKHEGRTMKEDVNKTKAKMSEELQATFDTIRRRADSEKSKRDTSRKRGIH